MFATIRTILAVTLLSLTLASCANPLVRDRPTKLECIESVLQECPEWDPKVVEACIRIGDDFRLVAACLRETYKDCYLLNHQKLECIQLHNSKVIK